MAQRPSDTILVAIRITLRIRESKVRNPDPPDRRKFVLCECILVASVNFTHFRANDVICSLVLRATQTCCHTCGQCERTRTQVEQQVRQLVSESFHTGHMCGNLLPNLFGNMGFP